MSSSQVFLPSPPSGSVDVLIVAGEHSGDQHAASMVREALGRAPGLRIAALGGPELARSGAQLLHDLTATSVIGFVEVLSHARFFSNLFKATLEWIDRHRPKAVCFIDYPGFNLRLAKALKKKGLSRKGGGPISLLYYISPQIWAWKGKRRFEMAETLDALSVIFPFEVGCYADTSLPTTFVGHPFVSESYAPPVRFDPSGPLLLLPGSRRQPVRKIFPPLLRALERLGSDRRAVVLYPSDTIKTVLENARPPAQVELRRTGTPIEASAVLTSSGTMSMHCALAGIPGAIVYRTNPITYLLGRMLVKTPYIGIANLLLNEAMYPEYIQDAARPEALALELKDCLENKARQARSASLAIRLHEILRQPATGTVGDWFLAQLG